MSALALRRRSSLVGLGRATADLPVHGGVMYMYLDGSARILTMGG
jgi:hypothetical protein